MKKYNIYLAGTISPNILPSRPTFSVLGDSIEGPFNQRGQPLLTPQSVSIIKNGKDVVAIIPADAAIQVVDISDSDKK